MNDSADPDDLEFGFLCKVCRTRMYASSSQIGEKIECPDCFTKHKISPADLQAYQAKKYKANRPAAKSEQALQPRLATDNADDEYALAPLDKTVPVQAPATSSAARKPTEDHIRAPCPTCNWIYVGKPETKGHPTTCYECGTIFTIKPRHVHKPKQRVKAYDPKIGVAPAAELAEQEDRSAELMDKAHAHRKRIAAKAPKKIKRPFAEGIYTFPFMSRVVQVWVSISILSFLIMMIASYALSMDGIGIIIGMFTFLTGIPLGVFLVCSVGFQMLTLFTTSANGYPQPEEWPRFDFGEWATMAIFFWFSASVALLPGALVGFAMPWYGKWIAHGVSGLLFHPFVLLSMFDANSPVIPCTRQIQRTLSRATGAWAKFYGALAPVLLVCIAVCVVTVLTSRTPAGIPMFAVATVVFSIGMTIYFRLVGRLAWVLGDVPTYEQEMEAMEAEALEQAELEDAGE